MGETYKPTQAEQRMPELEKKQTVLQHKITQWESKVANLDDGILATRKRIEKNLAYRRGLGSPRSFIRGVGANSIFSEMHKHNNKSIHWLEDNLDRVLKSHDRVVSEIEELKEDVNRLRRGHMLQVSRWKAVRSELIDVKSKIAESMNRANEIMELKDEIDEEIEDMKETDAVEQKEFEAECARLAKFINERLEGVAYLATKTDEDQAGQLTEAEEHELKKQMTNLTTSMKLTAMKEAHAQSRETMYQAAFDKLRRLTGIMDIRQMVTGFIDAEDRNFALFRYIQNVNRETKQVRVAAEQIRKEIDDIRGSAASAGADKKSTLANLESRLEKIRQEEELLKKRTLVLQSKMRECTSRVASLFDAIGGRDMPAVSAGALAGADESDDSASVPGSTPRSARGDAARPKSRSATRRVIAAKKAKEGGLDAVISRDRRRSRREKRGSVAGSVAGSMAEVERLSKMDVNNVNVLRFLGLIEQRAMDITTSFAQQHMPEGVKFSDVPIDGPPVPFARDKRKFHIALPAAEDDDKGVFDVLAGDADSTPSDTPRRRTPAARRSSVARGGDSSSSGVAKPVDVEALHSEIAMTYEEHGIDIKQLVRPGKPVRKVADSKKVRRRHRTAALSETMQAAQPGSPKAHRGSPGALRSRTPATRSHGRIGAPAGGLRPSSSGADFSRTLPARR